MAEILFDKLNRPRLTSALTIEERAKRIKLLTNEQIQVINNTRRYKAISIFANKHMIAENDWVLVDYKISGNYKEKGYGEPLFCECGRELKYQYVIESKDGKQKELGFKHYLELTNLNPDVARQIVMSINQLNLKVDEILVLLEYGYHFPTDQYIEYNKFKNVSSLNDTQVLRIEEFRKYNLPLLIADYEDMEKIIRLGKQRDRAYKMQKLSTIKETGYTKSSLKKMETVDTEINFERRSSLFSEDKIFKQEHTEPVFPIGHLKKGTIFKIYPQGTVVNLKGQGYLNLETNQYISEYDLFRKVLIVYGMGNNIIARRDDIYDVLKKQKHYTKKLKVGIPLTKEDLATYGYSATYFNKNVYVNINNNKWLNIVTFHVISNISVFNNVRNIVDFEGRMIAKRKNKNDILTSIEPKSISKRPKRK